MQCGKALHATQHAARLLSRLLDNQICRQGEFVACLCRGVNNVQEEARLSAIQKEVLGGPTDIPGGKALRATQRMARSLEQLWVHLNRQQHFGRLLAAAEQLGMRRVQLPVRILQAWTPFLIHGRSYTCLAVVICI